MNSEGVTTDGVSLGIDGAVATIVVDSKGRHNALKLAVWRALPGLVAAAEHAPAVRLIVFRGARGNFGAGNDIGELRSLPGDAAGALAYGRAMADAMQAVEAASKPVVMAMEGLCYGASIALALAGDIRIATDDATFAITPVKLGAMYLRSDLHRLVVAVGQGQARRLIYLAEAVPAAEAGRIGLVNKVVPSDRFDVELALLADTIARGSPSTQRWTKRLLGAVGMPTPEETDESLAVFVEATQGPDFAEGIDAFLAKRTASFE